MGHFLY
jgi:hypothetical protein